ncbi:MAG: TIGR00645 family protein, partial [Burkholderiaceae bacterium]|nr:TIGR00645 family protein [Burkholderiaceae bacterium]
TRTPSSLGSSRLVPDISGRPSLLVASWQPNTGISYSVPLQILLMVLSLIDVVMISNLLIMVIIGGYETFVSRLDLDGHPDQPEWLSHVNANILKVKLATAIIGISSIHLLKTFISAESLSEKTMLWQTLIHLAFILSALSIAWIDRMLSSGSGQQH